MLILICICTHVSIAALSWMGGNPHMEMTARELRETVEMAFNRSHSHFSLSLFTLTFHSHFSLSLFTPTFSSHFPLSLFTLTFHSHFLTLTFYFHFFTFTFHLFYSLPPSWIWRENFEGSKPVEANFTADWTQTRTASSRERSLWQAAFRWVLILILTHRVLCWQ